MHTVCRTNLILFPRGLNSTNSPALKKQWGPSVNPDYEGWKITVQLLQIIATPLHTYVSRAIHSVPALSYFSI